MKLRVLFLILLAVLCLGQTAKFPTAVATWGDLLKAKDNSRSTLTAGITAAATTIPVADGTKFVANQIVTVESEKIQIGAVSANSLTGCTRGFGGTTAATHINGIGVLGLQTDDHHNNTASEVIAIQTALGAGLANVNGTKYVADTTSWASGAAPELFTALGTFDQESILVIDARLTGCGLGGSARFYIPGGYGSTGAPIQIYSQGDNDAYPYAEELFAFYYKNVQANRYQLAIAQTGGCAGPSSKTVNYSIYASGFSDLAAKDTAKANYVAKTTQRYFYTGYPYDATFGGKLIAAQNVMSNAGYFTAGGTTDVNLGNTNNGQYVTIKNGGAVQMGTYSSEKILLASFTDGTANQKADIDFGNYPMGGELEVTLASGWAWANAAGSVRKVFSVLTNTNGTVYNNTSHYTDVAGPIANEFAIGELYWNATSSSWRIPIVHRTSAGNGVFIRIRSIGGGPTAINVATMTAVYTTDTTIFTAPFVSLTYNLGLPYGRAITTTDGIKYLEAVWENSTDKLKLYVPGTGAPNVAMMTITAGGKVGIGTTVPSAKLHISDTRTLANGEVTEALRLEGVRAGDVGTNNQGIYQSAFSELYSGTQAEMARIEYTLPEAVPATGYFGQIKFRVASNAAGGSGTFADALTIRGSSANGAANVGIGTTVPGARLTVNDPTAPTDNTTFWPLQLSNSGGGAASLNLGLGLSFKDSNSYQAGITALRINKTNNYASDLAFHTNAGSAGGPTEAVLSERMRITAAGNVGIGTSSPLAPLEVNSDNIISIGGVGGVATGKKGLQIYYRAAEDLAVLQGIHQGTGYKPIALNAYGGNVGIGTTSPNALLDVNGTARAASFVPTNNGNTNFLLTAGGQNVLRFYNPTADGNLQFYDGTRAYQMQMFNAGTQTVQLHSAGVSFLNGGNVGIGTTTPTAKLSFGTNAGNVASRFALYEDVGGANMRGIGMANPSVGVYGLGFWAAGPVPTDTNMHVFIKDGGNVGIGTTAPAAKLDIWNGAAFNADSEFARFGTGGATLQQRFLSFGNKSSGTPYIQGKNDSNAATNITLNPEGGAVFFGGDAHGVSFIAGANNHLRWNGRTSMHSPSDGILRIMNAAENNFNMIQLGGWTSSFPALKRNGANLHLRYADDSGFSNLFAGQVVFNDWLTASSSLCGNGALGQNMFMPYGDANLYWLATHGNLGGSVMQFGQCGDVNRLNDIIFARKAGATVQGALVGTVNETMRLGYNGHVGINDPTPATRLSVRDDTSVSARISLRSAGTDDAFIGHEFYTGTSALYWSGGMFVNKSSLAMAFFTAADGTNPRVKILNDGKVGIGNITPTYQLQISTDSAAKPNGGSWSNPSDRRLKDNIRPFSDGLAVLKQISPKVWELNGKASLPTGSSGIGVIAQDVAELLPYSVSTISTKLEPTDESDTELLTFNASALPFILVNAVKDLEKQTLQPMDTTDVTPACSSATRGQQYFVKDDQLGDSAKLCGRAADGTFAWKTTTTF